MEAYDVQDLNVMVVDDNRHMRFLVRTILNTFAIRSISEAEDGSDALKNLKTFAADLIITDWLMEPLDGLDFTRMIRTSSDSMNPFVPIILLTGHTELARVMEARDAGITEFLAKPVSPLMLYKRMTDIIEYPRQFIRADRFTGPDRRRKSVPIEGPDRRVA